VAVAHDAELIDKDGDEPPPHFTRWNLVACGGKLRHPLPMALPEGVIGEAAVEMSPIIVVDMISKCSIQKAISSCGLIARQIRLHYATD
jgi:hypothetical protein